MCDAITYAKLTTLKSMPNLKALRFMGSYHEKDLKKVMPFVIFDDIITADGIWDVEAKQLHLFQDLPINDWPSLS